MKHVQTHYQVLQIAENADQELIDVAWKVLMRRFHPDGSEPNAEKAVRINIAHDVLSSPEKRAEYNAELHASRVRVRPQGVDPIGPNPGFTTGAYPAAYPTAYPSLQFDPSAVADVFGDALKSGFRNAMENAGAAVLEHLGETNPIIAEILRKRRQAG